MMRIGDVMPLGGVLLDLDCPSKKRVFEKISLVFEDSLDLARGEIFRALLDRERLGTTGIGGGCAIPHARVKSLRRPACALARLKEPIPFDAADNRPVDLLFFLLAPENAKNSHLQMLAQLAQALSSPDFVAALRAAKTPEEAARIVEEAEESPRAAAGG